MEEGSGPPPPTAPRRGGPKSKGRRKGPKKKMTKEERRAKYTALARERRGANMKRKRDKNLTCYRCQRTGHTAENCTWSPDERNGDAPVCPPAEKQERGGGNRCYKCGSFDHRIHLCPEVKPFLPSGRTRIDYSKLGDLPYAVCYVCHQRGHLASFCNESTKGLYPRGGACRECGAVDHLAADCPRKKVGEEERKSGDDDDDANSDGSSNAVAIEDYLEEPTAVEVGARAQKRPKKRRVVNF